MRKRILCLFMAFALCVSLLPPTVWAEQDADNEKSAIATANPVSDTEVFHYPDVYAPEYIDVYTPEYIETLHAQFKVSGNGNALLLGDVNSPDLRIRYASQILAKSNIVLARAHPSGVQDSAFAYNNILDTSNGKQASRSAYGNAPGGSVSLDIGLLKILLDLEEKYGRISVSEIAGASHSKNSLHYSGLAMDVTYVGTAVSTDRGKEIYQFLTAKGYKLSTVISGTVYEDASHYHIALSGPTSGWDDSKSDDFVDVGTNFYAYIINTTSWLHLSNDGDNNVTARTGDADNQIWHFERLEGGAYKITSLMNRNKCLDVENFGQSSGTNVGVANDNGGSAQRWLIYGENAAYVFRAECTDCVLDITNSNYVSGVNVQMWESNSTDAQKFQIWKIDEPAPHTPSVDVANGTYMISSALMGKVLDISGAEMEQGANLQLWRNLSIDSQKFTITKNGNYYTMVARHSGMAVDVVGGVSASETNVAQCPLNGHDAQNWKFEDAGDGYVYIHSALGYYLDVCGGSSDDGTNVWTYNFNGGTAQKFKLYPTSDASLVDVPNGTYMISSALMGKALDISGAEMQQGANLQLWRNLSIDSQKFRITRNGDYYTMVARHSDMALDVVGAVSASGTNVYQWPLNGNDAQNWKFEDAGDGYVYIRSALGYYLDVCGGASDDGTNVWTYTFNGGMAQKFKLYPTSDASLVDVPNGTYMISSALMGKALDISGAEMEQGANLQLWRNLSIDSQKFRITRNGDYYTMVVRHSDMAVDVVGGISASETNVAQCPLNGHDAQNWKFEDAGNGYVYIRSALGYYLDVCGGASDDGTNVWTYTFNGGMAQKFKLYSTSDAPLVDVPNGTYMISSALMGKALDISGAEMEQGANLQLWRNLSIDSQKFRITRNGDYYTIVARHSDMALDVVGAVSASGTNVYQWPLNGNDAQNWKFEDAGDGYVYIRSALGYYLDVCGGASDDGTNVWTYNFNGGTAQKFKLYPTSDTPLVDVPNGTYMISSALMGKALDISGAEMEQGANLQLWRNLSIDSQKFTVTKNGDYYTMVMRHSGMAVDVVGGISASETNVAQCPLNGHDAQNWKFEDAGDGYVYIRSALGYYLDVCGGASDDGTNVWMYTFNGGMAQKFKLYPTSDASLVDVPNGTYMISSALMGKVLDISGAEMEQGANLQLWRNLSIDSQKFTVTKNGDYYTMVARHSGMAVDVVGGISASETNVAQCPLNGHDAQNWKFEDAGDGYVYIRSALGYYLDVCGGASEDGANIWTYTFHGGMAQKFKLSSVSPGDSADTSALIKNVNRNQGTVIATVECSDTNLIIFCAVYHNSGKMISVETQQISKAESYDFQFENTSFDYAKVFIVDGDFRPLCESKKS